jgi:ankyrin repeat protein
MAVHSYEPFDAEPELMDAIFNFEDDVESLLVIMRVRNLNIQNALGRTPLFMAANKKDNDLIDRFLAEGANPNIVDHEGNNPMHAVCARYDDNVVGNITAYGTRLYRSAIRSLADSSININHRNNAGQTPLFLSCAGDDYPAVELLLKLNADPTIADNDGVLPSAVTTKRKIKALLEPYEFPVKDAVDDDVEDDMEG